MKKLINILGGCLFIFLIISCGNESANHNQQVNQLVKEKEIQDNSQILETLKKKALFYSKAEKFKFILNKDSELLNITEVVLSADMTGNLDEKKICEEVLVFIGGEKVIFKSTEESASLDEQFERYSIMQKGTVEIRDNTYNAELYYIGESTIKSTWFHGKLVFELPVKSLKGELLDIEIKGKQ